MPDLRYPFGYCVGVLLTAWFKLSLHSAVVILVGVILVHVGIVLISFGVDRSARASSRNHGGE